MIFDFIHTAKSDQRRQPILYAERTPVTIACVCAPMVTLLGVSVPVPDMESDVIRYVVNVTTEINTDHLTMGA